MVASPRYLSNILGACFYALILTLEDGGEVFFHAAGKDELYIGLRFVIDQEVQLAAVEPCFGKRVLYGYTVDGEKTPI